MKKREINSALAGMRVALETHEHFGHNQTRISNGDGREAVVETWIEMLEIMHFGPFPESKMRKFARSALKGQAKTGWTNLGSGTVMDDIIEKLEGKLSSF